MAETKIEWAEAVWNPVTGCTKISPGCQNCYAERMSKRLAGRCGYPKENPFAVTLHPERLDELLRWRKPRKIFVCSMGDLFHKDVPFEFIGRIFGRAHSMRQHTFMVLTKRPERMKEFIEWYQKDWLAGFESAWPREYQHLWLGVTCENQAMADKRIPVLLQIPAALHWISYEPGLGPLDLTHIGGDRFGWGRIDALNGLRYIRANATESGCEWETAPCAKLGLIVAGGESGPGARPLHPDWVRWLRDQCVSAGVPYFFKQWGEWLSHHQMGNLSGACKQTIIDGLSFYRVGKKNAGRLLDNQEWSQFPEVPRA